MAGRRSLGWLEREFCSEVLITHRTDRISSRMQFRVIPASRTRRHWSNHTPLPVARMVKCSSFGIVSQSLVAPGPEAYGQDPRSRRPTGSSCVPRSPVGGAIQIEQGRPREVTGGKMGVPQGSQNRKSG